jgi:hypothetical protein
MPSTHEQPASDTRRCDENLDRADLHLNPTSPWQHFGNVHPSNASSTSRNPDNLDHFAGSGQAYAAGANLRALWGDFPVVVRVHLGAFKKPRAREIWRNDGTTRLTAVGPGPCGSVEEQRDDVAVDALPGVCHRGSCSEQE